MRGGGSSAGVDSWRLLAGTRSPLCPLSRVHPPTPGADPQDNTFAQRAWLYGQDPGLTVMSRGAPRAPDKAYMSLAIDGNSLPVARGRKADITLNEQERNLRPGVNVWADEIA